MKYRLSFFFVASICISFLISCGKSSVSVGDAQGGLLPTNYIYIKDGSFTPSNITAVRGSSFTFVNQAAVAKGVYSSDSMVINKPTIEASTSYYFKKDTVGTIFYFMAGKPNVVGSITLTP
jgi:hypothetical protein